MIGVAKGAHQVFAAGRKDRDHTRQGIVKGQGVVVERLSDARLSHRGSGRGFLGPRAIVGFGYACSSGF